MHTFKKIWNDDNNIDGDVDDDDEDDDDDDNDNDGNGVADDDAPLN